MIKKNNSGSLNNYLDLCLGSINAENILKQGTRPMEKIKNAINGIVSGIGGLFGSFR